MAWVVLVAVEKTAYHFDREYSYLVPDTESCPGAGCRVSVPFGYGNRTRVAMVLRAEERADTAGLKSICSVIDSSPVLSGDLLGLISFLKTRTFCTMYEAAEAMIPIGRRFNTEEAYTVRDGAVFNSFTDTDSASLFEYIKKRRTPAGTKEIAKRFGESGTAALERLCSLGVLERHDSFRYKITGTSSRVIRLLPDSDCLTDRMTPRQSEVYAALCDLGEVTVAELCYYTGATDSVLKNLCRLGACEIFTRTNEKDPYAYDGETLTADLLVLSDEQQKAYDELKELCESGKYSTELLYGVTGSGKTLIYIKLIAAAISHGKTAIMMVPEISLTPQTTARFRAYFGDKVAILHSGLSVGERTEQWRRLKSGDALVAVGTRSAVFAPLDNLGIIIMDEEQESTYHSERSPRFHAREVAQYRAHSAGTVLLLGSATPCLETFYLARTGRYGLHTLSQRYGENSLAKVSVVDMNSDGIHGVFSSKLVSSLERCLKNKEQSILLYNRRGYNTVCTCASCRTVFRCPNCSISLTYHHACERLICHYCGYSVPVPRVCSNCGSESLSFLGQGTQKIEESLGLLFPDARILRMDTDTTLARFSHEKLLGAFERREYDILIGTQMVAKGLDFPSVTLVGVLSADQTLFSNSYRANERAFSLITQVVGRSGRGEKMGHAVIQTYDPESEVIRRAAGQDYEGFYEDEIALRRAVLYPPFCSICVVGFLGISESETLAEAKRFLDIMKPLAQKKRKIPLRVMGPVSMDVARVGARYRYKLMIKCRADKAFRTLLDEIITEYEKSRKASVGMFVDLHFDE